MIEAYLTGASGFIGKRLHDKLEFPVPIPHKEITSIKLDPYKRFFFLSTYGNMADHESNSDVVKANVGDLIDVLRKTDFEDGLTSFVYISTSSVGRRTHTMYSRTKKAAEEILLGYAETFNAPVCIIRPFSVTGVGEQESHLIPKLIDSCMNGTEMPFVPEPTHDFIDVADVVDGILKLSQRHAKGIFELGSGVSYTNAEVKDIVEAVIGKKANVRIVKNMRKYDGGTWISRNMAARSYGWEPKKSLGQSVKEMCEHERAK